MIEEIFDQSTPLNGHIGAELKSSKYINDSEFVEAFMEKSIAYKFNNERGIAPNYAALGQGASNYYDSWEEKMIYDKNPGYNCNVFMNTLAEKIKITNFNRDMPGLEPGSNRIIDDKYFKRKSLIGKNNIKDYIFSSKIYYFYCYRNKNCVIGMMWILIRNTKR